MPTSCAFFRSIWNSQQGIKSKIWIALVLVVLCCFDKVHASFDPLVANLRSEKLHGKVKWLRTAISHSDSGINGRTEVDSQFSEFYLYNDHGNLTYWKQLQGAHEGESGQEKTGLYIYNDNDLLIEYEGFHAFGGKILRNYKGKELIEENAYKKDGSLAYKHIFFYSNGRLIRKEQFVTGKIYPSNIKLYDNKGNETETVFYNNNASTDSSILGRHTTKYDARNNVIETLHINYNTGQYQKETNKYDDKGNRIEQVTYKSRDIIDRRIIRSYDGRGEEKSAHHYDANGKLLRNSSFTYTYNVKGILIEKVEKSSYFEREKAYSSTTTELYQDIDKHGNYLRKTFVIDGERGIQSSGTYRKIAYYE